MPKSSTPLLRWSEDTRSYEIIIDGRLYGRLRQEDGSAWSQWLETHTSFAFQGRAGHLSAIKEARPRGAGYWYAYRSSGKRTAKRYLGQARNVTIERLEEISGTLTHASSDEQALQEKAEMSAPQPAQTSLLLSKLLPPRLPSEFVERPRLLQQLGRALERKITLLVAPTGFGKTSVISQWIRARQRSELLLPVAWVSLDSGDNDLFRFWHYLIAACQTFQQDLGQAALAFLAEAMLPPFATPLLETALTLLLNDLAQRIQSGLLVLDDYHVIEEPRIHEMLTFFLEHLPPTLSVLLVTRVEPRELPLLRWRARGELSELHVADLRFSLQETADFLRQTTPVAPSDATLKQLDSALHGWIAGLRLLTLTGTTSLLLEQVLAPLAEGSPSLSPYEPILDYFVQEILAAQPEQVKRFLLQTSMLSRLNGPLCAAVTGAEDSAVQLAALEQAGLFLEALDEAGGWYRFHALFVEAMRREAAQRLNRQTLHTLSLRASTWYEQHAMTTEAIEAALQAQAFERAAVLIEHVNIDGQTSELHTVRRWLRQIPERILRAHPMLCWLAALALQFLQEEMGMTTEGSEQVKALLRMAEEGWQKTGSLAELGLITAFHSIHAWKTGQFASSMEYAQQALEQLPNNRQDRRIQTFRDICLFVVGTGYMYAGQFGQARRCFLEAHEGSLATDDRHFKNGILLLVGSCSYVLGELHQAHEYEQQALSAARRQKDREIIAQALRSLASISFEWNQLALAEQQAHEAQMFALEEETDLRNSIALQLALCAHAWGRLTSAQQQVAVLLARLQVTTTPEATLRLPEVLFFSARLALETGDIQAAQQIMKMPDLQGQPEARIFQARLLLAQQKPREACRLLEPQLAATQNPRQVLEVQILLSLAYATCQEGERARQWLQQALSQARAEGFVRIFLAEGEALARLLRQLVPTLQEKAVRSYALAILRAFTQTGGEDPPGSASTERLLIEPLSAQEQRVLQLLVTGETNQQIARELVVSVNTIKSHLKNLYRKLGVSNRLQASEAARHLKQSKP